MSDLVKHIFCGIGWHYPGVKEEDKWICKWCGERFLFKEEELWKKKISK